MNVQNRATTRSQDLLESSRANARRRGIAFLKAQDLVHRRTADGVAVGIQATIATGQAPQDGIDLYSLLDGMVAHPATDPATFFKGEAGEGWMDILSMVEKKLGLSLEPELFSNMLVVAYLGAEPDQELRALSKHLLSTFRDSDADGLYHFFVSLQFACDIDCTAVAARARLISQDIDLATREGAFALRRINDAILRSACVRDVPSGSNLTHGKENGELRRYVLKVYLDDHRVQGADCDRGLKINPVVVSNALYPLLEELKYGLRDPAEFVRLLEYVEGEALPRTGYGSVADIVIANVGYAMGYLLSGAWRDGCRYYPSPDAFLCSFSENVRAFPEVFEPFGAVTALRDAILERRASDRTDLAGDPSTSLNRAFRAIAAINVGLEPTEELDALVAAQDTEGAWSDGDCLYCFGSSTSIPLVFRSSLVTTAFAIRALRVDPPSSGSGVHARTGRPSAVFDWEKPLLERVFAAVS